MVEVNKFESMSQEALEDRMWHHLVEGADAAIAGKSRVKEAHIGWYARLNRIQMRRFGIDGQHALTTPEFARRHGLDIPLEVKTP